MPRRIAAFAAILITVGTGALTIVPSSEARAPAVTAAGPVRARMVAAHLTGVGEAWFFGTSCTAVKRCMAVGQKVTPAGTGTLAEAWAAGRWRVLPTPSPTGMTDSWLVAVSCSAAAACMAVGSAMSPNAPNAALAEYWNGLRWRMVPLPVPPGTINSGLFAVWCRARWGCLALGKDLDKAGSNQTLAERWTGSRWLVLPTSGLPPSFAVDGVTCHGPACMAVGSVTQPRTGDVIPFAERSNGRRWQGQSMPASPQVKFVNGVAVSCPSTTLCLAVGYSGTTEAVPFADVWTRGGWHLLRLPASMPAFTQLNGLSCPAVNQCVAVGGRSNEAVRSAPVALAWNGRAWRMLRVPGPVRILSQFTGVSCLDPGGCLAVGLIRIGLAQIARTIAEWWNGRAWQPLRLPA